MSVPGDDSRYISADRVFTTSNSPGLNRQTNYVRNSVFAAYDYRDNPDGMSKRGGRYAVQYSWFHDQRAGDYSFRRTEIDLQQFVPLFNKTHVFALRANTALSMTDAGQQVPFFLQPTLGGSDDLRGYRPFRFSDRNRMFMNAEYRWEIFSGLDGAVFADAGKVFPRRGMLNFKDLESTVGFGLRFNIRNTNFLRFDTGFSHEGFQFWIRFSDAFRWRRMGTTVGREVY
ncbi:MAG: BamA/TamA family outer membrane protein [Bryobacteraceae bacterium]|nr:BamA/TamA family outer membrane protein [Bryobacteraceae bacterium]